LLAWRLWLLEDVKMPSGEGGSSGVREAVEEVRVARPFSLAG
jgi:hypothetical protein